MKRFLLILPCYLLTFWIMKLLCDFFKHYKYKKPISVHLFWEKKFFCAVMFG